MNTLPTYNDVFSSMKSSDTYLTSELDVLRHLGSSCASGVHSLNATVKSTRHATNPDRPAWRSCRSRESLKRMKNKYYIPLSLQSSIQKWQLTYSSSTTGGSACVEDDDCMQGLGMGRIKRWNHYFMYRYMASQSHAQIFLILSTNANNFCAPKNEKNEKNQVLFKSEQTLLDK